MYSEYEIFGTNQQMRKVIEQACERLMETYGLRHVELDILYLISHEKQKDTAKDLIEIQHLSKAHISKSVDNLNSMDILSWLLMRRITGKYTFV